MKDVVKIISKVIMKSLNFIYFKNNQLICCMKYSLKLENNNLVAFH